MEFEVKADVMKIGPFFAVFRIADPLAVELSSVVYIISSQAGVKRVYCCVQGQGRSDGTNVFAERLWR